MRARETLLGLDQLHAPVTALLRRSTRQTFPSRSVGHTTRVCDERPGPRSPSTDPRVNAHPVPREPRVPSRHPLASCPSRLSRVATQAGGHGNRSIGGCASSSFTPELWTSSADPTALILQTTSRRNTCRSRAHSERTRIRRSREGRQLAKHLLEASPACRDGLFQTQGCAVGSPR